MNWPGCWELLPSLRSLLRPPAALERPGREPLGRRLTRAGDQIAFAKEIFEFAQELHEFCKPGGAEAAGHFGVYLLGMDARFFDEPQARWRD